ncbi:MAG: DUF2062 domain-containing protein [Geobacter sp.]|nr:DUF2062 domain-containing protein [Geobacter sp.]
MTKPQLKQRMLAILALDSHPSNIAAGFAVGVFIGCTPLFGIHTALAVVLAFIFRLNKLTTITGSWVNTPLTVLPILMASYRLGEFILGNEPQPVSFASLDWHHLREYATALFIGSALIGLAAALISYALCYWLVILFRRKDPGLVELTNESLLTGEDLERHQQVKEI